MRRLNPRQSLSAVCEYSSVSSDGTSLWSPFAPVSSVKCALTRCKRLHISNWNSPTEWYLHQFSRNNEWKHGVDAEMIVRVEGAISTEAIHFISEGLRANGFPANERSLGNLLRHWARIQLLEEGFTGHNEQRKRTRSAAKSLAKTMAKMAEQLDAPMAEVSHNASRYVQDQYRISYTKHLFNTLRRCLDELTPAVQALSEEKFPRGRRQNTGLHLPVETLLVIFEYVSGKRRGPHI